MKPAVLKFTGALVLAVALGSAFASTSDEAWLTLWSLAFVFLAVPLILLSVRDLIVAYSATTGPAFGFWLMLHVCAIFAAAIGYLLGSLADSSDHPKTKWLIVILPVLVYLTPLLLWLHALPLRLLRYLLHAILGRK